MDLKFHIFSTKKSAKIFIETYEIATPLMKPFGNFDLDVTLFLGCRNFQ